jgi:DNA-binding transcriptional MocR family regulator
MNSLVQSIPRHAGAATIAARVERAIAGGELEPGDRLPPVRELAESLAISPATAAAAYRTLRERGLVTANRRRGTVVVPTPPLRVRGAQHVPAGVQDLASGNPDPALLPPLAPALRRLDPSQLLYGVSAKLPALVECASAAFAADDVAGDIAVTSGALDGIERALQTHLRAGDRVAVEDPTWPRVTDLVHALGLQPEPVPVDERGLRADGLATALRRGARAVIATPRAQNPTGAAVDRARAREVQEVLTGHPGVLVVEDDYAAGVAGAPYVALHHRGGRFAVVRSLSKVFGPDLRVAVVAGDALTVSRLEGRQLVGPGWVSHLLQQTAALLWRSPRTPTLLARAERSYEERRTALVEALARHGIGALGRSGLGVWVPLAEETEVTRSLLERGFAVSPGERYRLRSGPGIRITTTTLAPRDAGRLAAAIHETLNARPAGFAA